MLGERQLFMPFEKAFYATFLMSALGEKQTSAMAAKADVRGCHALFTAT